MMSYPDSLGAFRSHRGVRGLGYFRTHRGMRGLGQTPIQDWLNANPQCYNASTGMMTCPVPASVQAAQAALPMSQPSGLSFLSPGVAATAANPTQVTAAVADAPAVCTAAGCGPMTANLPNLEGQLARAVTYAMATPATISQIGDPTAYLQGIVSTYCASAGGLYANVAGGQDIGCGNASSLVAQYAAELQSSLNAHGSAVQAQIAAAGGTTAAAGTTAANTQTRVVRRQPQRFHSTVVNPSPPSQSTTDGSNLTSPLAVSNIANGTMVSATGGTTTGDIIPGVDNAVLFIGIGVVGLVLLMGVK